MIPGSAEVVSSILVEQEFSSGAVAESVSTRVRNIQPLVDEL